MIQSLEQVLRRCIVKLKVPNKFGWGTGFFVAPNLVLTCAHVVKEASSPDVEIHWENQDKLEIALIEKIFPDPFDIALLRLSSTTKSYPCVYLDTDIKSGDVFYTFGYPEDFQPGAPVTFECEGITGDNPPFIKFKHGDARSGLSGAPLLNKRTGKVCGLVKFTRGTSLGGGGIPSETIFTKLPNLREKQEEFHKNNKTWIDALKSMFRSQVERHMNSYVKRCSERSQSLAKDFRESRFAVAGDSHMEWLRAPISGKTTIWNFKEEIEKAFRDFDKKIRIDITFEEIELLRDEINSLANKLNSEELNDLDKSAGLFHST